jgi:hypothetical protein
MNVYVIGNPGYLLKTFIHSFAKHKIRKLLCIILYVMYSRRGENN